MGKFNMVLFDYCGTSSTIHLIDLNTIINNYQR